MNKTKFWEIPLKKNCLFLPPFFPHSHFEFTPWSLPCNVLRDGPRIQEVAPVVSMATLSSAMQSRRPLLKHKELDQHKQLSLHTHTHLHTQMQARSQEHKLHSTNFICNLGQQHIFNILHENCKSLVKMQHQIAMSLLCRQIKGQHQVFWLINWWYNHPKALSRSLALLLHAKSLHYVAQD